MNYLAPLKDRKTIANGTMAFWFGLEGMHFAFKAGQAVDITLIDPPQTDDEGNTRTFSIASSPALLRDKPHEKNTLMIATRMRDTAFKNFLKKMPLGTKVKMTEPTGSMTLHKDAKKSAVMFAGGIGITPFRSMIESATIEKLQHNITLFYSNRTSGEAAFLDELQKWEKENEHFKLVNIFSDTDGRITVPIIKKNAPDIVKAICYIAGPMGFVKTIRELLVKVGADEDSIRFEEFAGY